MSHCSLIAVEQPLPALEARASSARADHDRQQTRLARLTTDFARASLTASPQIFSLLQAEIAQQELIARTALQTLTDAESALTTAQLVEEQIRAETARRTRRSVLLAELENHEMRLNEYHALHRSLPEKIELERQAHSALLAELASL